MNSSEKRKVAFSFVVPVRNVRDSLETFVARISAMGDRMNESYEIVFVDDGSTDGTGDKLATLAEKNRSVTAVELSRQFGPDAAVLAGYQHSSGRAVVSLDCTRHAVEAVVDLVARWREGFEIVSVAQAAKSGAKKSCPFTNFIKGCATAQGGQLVEFRLLDRKCVDAILANASAACTMGELVDWIGFRRAEIPAVVVGSAASSCDSVIVPVQATGHDITRKVSLLGMAMVAATVLYAVVNFALWPFGMAMGGWFHIGATLVGLFGLEFFMVGLIAFYVRQAMATKHSSLRYAVRCVTGVAPEKTEPARDDDDDLLIDGYRPIMLLT